MNSTDIAEFEAILEWERKHVGLPTDDNLRTLCKACHISKREWSKK